MTGKVQVICEWCGKKYKLTPSLFKRSKHHFCSKACSAKWRMLSRVETTCDFCGGNLLLLKSVYQGRQNHFCSTTCYSQWQKKDKSDRMTAICDQCGKRYIVSHSSQFSKLKHHFCSQKCYASWKCIKKLKCTCNYCGAEFESWPSQIKGKHNFCSHLCSEKWRSENERDRNHPLWNKVKCKCAWCEKTLWMPPNRVKRSDNFFCSKDCKAKWWSENISGKNHYNWRGGKSFEPYPPEFNKAFRQKIRVRDDYTCAICKMFGNNVHHINYVKEDALLSNCITLCHGCHIVTNFNRNYWQAKLSELMTARATRLGPEYIDVAVIE